MSLSFCPPVNYFDVASERGPSQSGRATGGVERAPHQLHQPQATPKNYRAVLINLFIPTTKAPVQSFIHETPSTSSTMAVGVSQFPDTASH